jgi:hypothetical protein
VCPPNLDELPVLAKLIVELEMDGTEKWDLLTVLRTIFIIYKYILETRTGVKHLCRRVEVSRPHSSN